MTSRPTDKQFLRQIGEALAQGNSMRTEAKAHGKRATSLLQSAGPQLRALREAHQLSVCMVVKRAREWLQINLTESNWHKVEQGRGGINADMYEVAKAIHAGTLDG